jgi:ABC-2 type transport system permease protein
MIDYRAAPMDTVIATMATARSYLQQVSAYPIQLIRWPLGPLFTFATWRITYGAAGHGQVDGVSVSGFLLVGIFGLITWTSSIWSSGYAIQDERDSGTSGSLFLSPVSRAAVVAGYGVGSFVWFLPSFAVLLLLGSLTGARLRIADPTAVALSVLCLIVASLAAGFTFSGLFILSRRGNLIANVIQSPIYLLSGLMVPLAVLPAWLRSIANAIPATHAIIALRAATLLGASTGSVGRELILGFFVSAVWFGLGLLGLKRVEHVAKRIGQLDLY